MLQNRRLYKFLKILRVISVGSTLIEFFCIFWNNKIHTLTFCDHLSNFQPVNSDLMPIRVFLDYFCSKATVASNEVCIVY